MINNHFSVILLVLFTFRLIAFKRSGHIAKTAAKQLVLIDVLSKKINKKKNKSFKPWSGP